VRRLIRAVLLRLPGGAGYRLARTLRVRASGDIWSQDFRDELAADRHFEASLVWRELAILLAIAVILIARVIAA
jgi:hypothetical protein